MLFKFFSWISVQLRKVWPLIFITSTIFSKQFHNISAIPNFSDITLSFSASSISLYLIDFSIKLDFIVFQKVPLTDILLTLRLYCRNSFQILMLNNTLCFLYAHWFLLVSFLLNLFRSYQQVIIALLRLLLINGA